LEKRTQYEVAIIIILVVASGLIISAQQQKYRQLSEEYASQTTELEDAQTRLVEAEETLSQYNISLKSLESDPVVRAANIIISRVGLEYFNQYFHDPTVQTPKWNPNVTYVNFKYNIQVGNYTTEQNVNFYFYPKFDQYYGVPIEENMQPFTVTAEEAKQLAINAELSDGPYPLEAYIQYTGPGDLFPLTGDEEKYIWRIVSWDDPPWANPRKRHSIHIDPNTGETYPIHEGGRTYLEEIVDTPEEALPMGIKGYVKLHYSELPERIILAGSENITFTIQASLISYTDTIDMVKLTVDPQNNDTYWIHGNFADRLRDMIVYEPSGVFDLKVGEPLNITCTLTVPASEIELTLNRYTLHCIGIGAENTLIVHDLST